MRLLVFTLLGFCHELQGVIVRVNEVGLHEAANFTRQWLQMSMPKRKLPPVQITADWLFDSSFFKLFHLPMAGQIQTQMTGLISEISLVFNDRREMEIEDCVALIRDLRVTLRGSVAADVLHWFRNTITRSVRKKIEQQYCYMMRSQWLPWVQKQLAQFPTNLTISHRPEVILVQSLEHVELTDRSIDAKMRSDLLWENELVKSNEGAANLTTVDLELMPSSIRMIDMVVDEHTVQSIVAAAHFAGHLRTTIQSPFLRTNCEVLCVGTVLPELQDALPNRTLRVEAATLSPPIVMLETGRSMVYMNASLEVFPEPPLPGVKGSILKISVDTDFILTMQMRRNKVKGYLNMVKAHAVVMDSKIGLMSQKTIDFLVNMSTPFLEDAVDLFLGRGLFIQDPFQFPSTNEQLSIHRGALRWEADLAVPVITRRLINDYLESQQKTI